MKKLLKWTALVLFGLFLWQGYGLLRDRQTLDSGLVRLHVVGASDSASDQSVKLQVRDAVLAQVSRLGTPETAGEALALLEANLSSLEQAANETLRTLGSADTAAVTLCREAFPIREYDSFTLPSGVYESLRVKIGEAEGKNWWCVVFPTLCSPGTDTEAAAVGAGFSQELTDAITSQDYEISFFLLDLLGSVESFLFRLFH